MKRITPIPVGNKEDIDLSAINLCYVFDPKTEKYEFSKAVFVIQEGEILDGKFIVREQVVREGTPDNLEKEIVAAATSLHELLLAHHVGKNAIATVETPADLTALGLALEDVV